MGDGRTDLFRSMWTRTTTNDSIHNPELYSKVKGKKVELSNDIKYMPNQKLHRNVSFIKSGVRILGFGLCWWSLDIGVTVLILAEVIGVGEELV